MNSSLKILSDKEKKISSANHLSKRITNSGYKNGKSNNGLESSTNDRIDSASLTERLKMILAQQDPDSKFINKMKLVELYDYVNKKHHGNIENNSYFLKDSLEKLCQINDRDYPELFEIRNLIVTSSGEVTILCKKRSRPIVF